jgi:AcrR family transcriptional regulator
MIRSSVDRPAPLDHYRRATAAHVDGRRVRGTRTRARILDAAVELLLRSHTQLRAKDVAALADVSLRTVFDHYPNMQSLYDDVLTRLERQVADSLVEIDPSLRVHDRVRLVVEQRERAHQLLAPLHRSLHYSPQKETSFAWQRTRQRLRVVFETQVTSVFGNEIRRLPDPMGTRQRIELITSFEVWLHLTHTQRVSGARRRQHTMLLLLRELDA